MWILGSAQSAVLFSGNQSELTTSCQPRRHDIMINDCDSLESDPCTCTDDMRTRVKMSVKRDESVFVARLQQKITFTQVTRPTEASVRALGYKKVRQEQFDVVLNFLKSNDMFVSLATGGSKSLNYACLPFVYDQLPDKSLRLIALVIASTCILNNVAGK